MTLLLLHRHGRQGRQPKALADLCVLEDGGRDGIEIQGEGGVERGQVWEGNMSRLQSR